MLRDLPRYMVPSPAQVLTSLPVNINGKVDRRALFQRLEDEANAPAQGDERKVPERT
jgi:acyl-coenzyme A synthetase/AMP-(fatty) acid ligase